MDLPKPSFNKCNVSIIAQETVYQGFFQMQKLTLQHPLHNGGLSDIFTREIFERGSAVGILPFDPLRDEVVLIEQFRPGALPGPDSPWLLELVAGVLDHPNEPAQVTAERELREEANLTCSMLHPICHYWVSPGGSTERVELFCGIVNTENAGGIFGLAEEHEDIHVHVCSRKAAIAGIESGRINNAATIIALQWLALHHEKIVPSSAF